MQVVDLRELYHSTAPIALALGYFDTFHLGHRALLQGAVGSGYLPAMFTFQGDIYGALGQDVLPVYGWEKRMRVAASFGVRLVLTLPAEPDVIAMSGADFLLLLSRLPLACILCGEDFRFGRGAAYGVDELRAFCTERGITCRVFSARTTPDGEKIGTARIRRAVESGDMLSAMSLLGRPYTVEGPVVHGRADGAKFGFPTANFPLPVGVTAPAFGVYIASVTLEDKFYPATVNVGAHPTVGDPTINVECYIMGYHGSLYGRLIEVSLYRYLRPVTRFDTVEDLRRQIRRDCQATADYFGIHIGDQDDD